MIESVQRIEPAHLETISTEISDVLTDLVSNSVLLSNALNPKTAANLADLIRIMNTYYSNLIEGHKTRPRDIERAIVGDFNANAERRNLQLEAALHLQVQKKIDDLALDNKLPEPASAEFIQWLHYEFYRNMPEEMLLVDNGDKKLRIIPGEWRSNDVSVGRHIAPSSHRIPDFINYFANRYSLKNLGKSSRILAIPAAHHRFNYIHPFLDGNGRVSRLMSHAMTHVAGISAHGLWSVSRGLARGLNSRDEYKKMMDYADSPRQGDLDGRGNLSLRALNDFTLWFLNICLDQIKYMSSLFELKSLQNRLRLLVARSESLKPEAAYLLEEALIRGEFERGEISRITGLPERSARRILNDLIKLGLLASNTPKGPLSLRFPSEFLDILFPRLFLET